MTFVQGCSRFAINNIYDYCHASMILLSLGEVLIVGVWNSISQLYIRNMVALVLKCAPNYQILKTNGDLMSKVKAV